MAGALSVPVRTIEIMKEAFARFTDDHPEPNNVDEITILLDSGFWQNGLFRQGWSMFLVERGGDFYNGGQLTTSNAFANGL
jgi:hypothetical protein